MQFVALTFFAFCNSEFVVDVDPMQKWLLSIGAVVPVEIDPLYLLLLCL